jgi:hypothetical protein
VWPGYQGCPEGLLATRLWKVNINMNKNFEDSLKCLKSKDGLEGIQELEAWDEISEIIPESPRKHLHIVVERPPLVSLSESLPLPQF